MLFQKSSYGLSFIKFHSKPDPNAKGDEAPKAMMKQATLGGFKLKEDKGDEITTGTLFAKRNKEAEKPATPLTGTMLTFTAHIIVQIPLY